MSGGNPCWLMPRNQSTRPTGQRSVKTVLTKASTIGDVSGSCRCCRGFFQDLVRANTPPLAYPILHAAFNARPQELAKGPGIAYPQDPGHSVAERLGRERTEPVEGAFSVD